MAETGVSDRLEISNYSISNDRDKFVVTAQIMSTELIPREILKRDIFKLKGKEARIEHIVPEVVPFAIVGEVLEVTWNDKLDAPFAEIAIFNDSKIDRELRKDLIEDQKLPIADRKYKGVSIGILKYSDADTHELIKIFPREVSFTESPVCEICTIHNVQQVSMEQFSMSEKNLDAIEKLYSARVQDKVEIIETKNKEIESVKADYDKKVKEFSASEKVYLEKIAEKDSQITEKDKKIAEMQIELNSANKKLELSEENTRVAEIRPLVQQLLLNSSYKQDSEIWKQKEERLLKKTKEDLIEMAEFSIRNFDIEKQKEIIKGNINITGMPLVNQDIDVFNLEKENKIEIPKENLKDVI